MAEDDVLYTRPFFQIGNKEYKGIRQHMGGRAEGTTGTRG